MAGFAGMARYSDCAQLRWQDIEFEPLYVVLRFVKRKHKVYKLKSSVRIARLEGRTVCFYSLLQQWLARSGGSPGGVVFPGFAARLPRRLTPSVPISDFRYRTCLSVGLSPEAFLLRFGTQSARSGGASAASNAGVPFEVWGQHGGWSSRASQLVYMACDVPTTLSTTVAIMPSVTAGDWHNAALVDSDSDESECELRGGAIALRGLLLPHFSVSPPIILLLVSGLASGHIRPCFHFDDKAGLGASSKTNNKGQCLKPSVFKKERNYISRRSLLVVAPRTRTSYEYS